MAVPPGLTVLDSMIWFPAPEDAARYQVMQGALGQHASGSPTAYLFGRGPSLPSGEVDPVEFTIEQMDRFGISRAVVDVGMDPAAADAVHQRPDRFVATVGVDPNLGMTALRQIDQAASEYDLRGVSLGPAFLSPHVPIDDKRMYPVYAKCIELDLTVFVTVGVPGPRVAMASQRVELLDDVGWFFPELRIVMRHGGEPWEDLAVKLMVKWPNLYYSTSAFAPRRYPAAIVDYANSQGADKILFAGYYAVGLTWDRIFAEFDQLPFKDSVWPKFLQDNALSVLGLSV